MRGRIFGTDMQRNVICKNGSLTRCGIAQVVIHSQTGAVDVHTADMAVY
jgi:hypothetical protein